MYLCRYISYLCLLLTPCPILADDVFDVDHFSRYLQSDRMLEIFRGTGSGGSVAGSEKPEASLLLGYGARILYEGKELEERENSSREAKWHALRLQLLGHVAVAAAHAQTDDGLEMAFRHLIEANRVIDRMDRFEPLNRNDLGKPRAIYAIRIVRLFAIPLGLTAHRLGRSTNERIYWTTARMNYEFAGRMKVSPWLLDQFWGHRGVAELEKERRVHDQGLSTAAVPKGRRQDVVDGLKLLEKEFEQLKRAVQDAGNALMVKTPDGEDPDDRAFRTVFELKQSDVDQDNFIRPEEIQVLERRIVYWRNWTANFVPR